MILISSSRRPSSDWLKRYIFKKDGTYVPMCGRVIVVAPDEYEAAQKQERILKLSSKRDELYLYYDRLAGGSIVELMKK